MIKCLGCMEDFEESVGSICPHCGYDQNTGKAENHHIEPGTFLQNRYILGKSIGAGGFGITYIAWDTVLDKKVAVKEYFPSEFATRLMGTTEVCPYDGEKTYQFEMGLESFVDEALRLAKLGTLNSIVHIFDSFVENCTAYIIMEYVGGETLRDKLKANGPMPYQDVVKYMVPVLRALDEVHKGGIIHRDIAPDNIKVDGDKVVLLDFGAARNATVYNSKSLSVIVKPGYAPEEQYRSRGAQGPWTDVYAIGAVMYHLITGKLPAESIERNIKDELKTPTELGFDLPKPLENAIMNALNVKAEDRIQSTAEFADALEGIVEMERVVIKKKDDNGRLGKKGKITIFLVAIITLVVVLVIVLTQTKVTGINIDKGATLKDYQNMPYAEVIEDLEKLNIDYKSIGEAEDKTNEDYEDKVAYQNYAKGTLISDIDVLEFKIAKGKVQEGKMPSLTNKTLADAVKLLKEKGFTNIETKTKQDSHYKNGIVCDQSIESGKTVAVDQKIVVYETKNPATTKQSNNKNNNNNNNNNYSNTKKKSSNNKSKTTVKKTVKQTTKKVTRPPATAVNWD